MPHRLMARSLLSLLLVICILPAMGERRSKTLRGLVLTERGRALKSAVVQVRIPRSLWVRSFTTRADGRFQFAGLRGDLDYEVNASFRGKRSAIRQVSRFDTTDAVDVDLFIPEGWSGNSHVELSASY